MKACDKEQSGYLVQHHYWQDVSTAQGQVHELFLKCS
jgi:hypothetical protein